MRLLLVLFASPSLICPKQQLSTNQRLINQTNNSQNQTHVSPQFSTSRDSVLVQILTVQQNLVFYLLLFLCFLCQLLNT